MVEPAVVIRRTQGSRCDGGRGADDPDQGNLFVEGAARAGRPPNHTLPPLHGPVRHELLVLTSADGHAARGPTPRKRYPRGRVPVTTGVSSPGDVAVGSHTLRARLLAANKQQRHCE